MWVVAGHQMEGWAETVKLQSVFEKSFGGVGN